MKRRDFVKVGSMLAAGSSQEFNMNQLVSGKGGNNKAVDFMHDGLFLTPKEYTEILLKLADEGKIKADFYSNGGVVEELEVKFASLLGKEAAVFMPTGTLANHIGIRHLAGNNRRVIVQEQSHIYNDVGDCSQILSGLNLIPLAENAVEFPVSDIEKVVAKTKAGRVESPVGVIAIETPVRRQFDKMVGWDTISAVTEFARKNGIKTHLDGARIFVQAVHTNMTPAQYGAAFDTVFTSMWKCFNASSGAILAGSKVFCEKLFHERRMFGGGLPAAWPFAAVALHYADGFIDEYKRAWKNAQNLVAELKKDDRFSSEEFKNGSHIFSLNIKRTNLPKFREALAKRNVSLGAPTENGFLLKVNPSINKETYQNLSGYFLEALKEAV